MPAFKRFGPGDQVDNVLIVEPRYDLTSGSQGWRGSPEGSASLSLYGGSRRRPGVFSSIEYQSFAPNVGQTGNPRRGLPLTASVSLAFVRNEPLNFSLVNDSRWGDEHWDVLQRLYQDYSVYDADYVTASYDHYCVYFNRDSRNVVAAHPGFNQSYRPTGSFCLESWVKPFQTSSQTNDFTVVSMNRTLWFGVTGSTGMLAFSSSLGAFTASLGPTVNRWSHVAVRYDLTSLTGTFLINGGFAGSFGHPGLPDTSPYEASLTVGNSFAGPVSGDTEVVPGSSGSLQRSFHGFIGETRVWFVNRSIDEIQSTMFAPLEGSSASGPILSLRMNEGPIQDFGDNDTISIPSRGSGSMNQARFVDFNAVLGSLLPLFGFMSSFNDRVGPVWHPNDNASFVVPKRLVGTNVAPLRLFGELLTLLESTTAAGDGPAVTMFSPVVSKALVVDIPSAFYGRQVVPGSVRMTCRGYEDFGLIRTLVDDGRGGLYLSGSASSSSLESREEYAGVVWNKVGNVFYGEGLIVVKDPALLDFGRDDGAFDDRSSTFSLSFRGDSRIPVKTLMCRIDHGEFNCSNNPTFYDVDDDGSRVPRHPSGSVRATTVGLYNSDRELVGVARLADPVRIRARDRLNIKLRIDF